VKGVSLAESCKGTNHGNCKKKEVLNQLTFFAIADLPRGQANVALL